MNHVRGAETGYVGSVAASNPLLLNTPPTKVPGPQIVLNNHGALKFLHISGAVTDNVNQSDDPRSVRLQHFAYEVDFDKETIRIAEVDGQSVSVVWGLTDL